MNLLSLRTTMYKKKFYLIALHWDVQIKLILQNLSIISYFQGLPHTVINTSLVDPTIKHQNSLPFDQYKELDSLVQRVYM